MSSRRVLLAAVVASILALAARERPADPASIVGNRFSYTVEAGDSLTLVSARFGVELGVLATMSGLAADAKLQIGQVLQIDNRHIVPKMDASLVVNIPQRMLFLRGSGDLRAFPVAVGRPSWPTPLGAFTVLSKEIDPAWDVPTSIQAESRRAGRPVLKNVPPGPDNPLGKYWLALSLPSIGLHGTNNPASVFAFTTHGCIRLGPADIALLFNELPVGASGAIVYEPALMTLVDNRVLVEVHRDVYKQFSRGRDLLVAEAGRLGVSELIDWNKLDKTWYRASGAVVDVTR